MCRMFTFTDEVHPASKVALRNLQSGSWAQNGNGKPFATSMLTGLFAKIYPSRQYYVFMLNGHNSLMWSNILFRCNVDTAFDINQWCSWQVIHTTAASLSSHMYRSHEFANHTSAEVMRGLQNAALGPLKSDAIWFSSMIEMWDQELCQKHIDGLHPATSNASGTKPKVMQVTVRQGRPE